MGIELLIPDAFSFIFLKILVIKTHYNLMNITVWFLKILSMISTYDEYTQNMNILAFNI